MAENALTYLVQAQITSNDDRVNGKVLTRPALLVTDGLGTTYAVDVDIGLKDPLRNVPIAVGNRDLIYAEAGAACTLTRTASGQYEVSSFSKEMPGTYIQVPVDLGTFTLGAIVDIGLNSRPLTLEELGTFNGGFGSTPLGAVAVFKGTTLIRIV